MPGKLARWLDVIACPSCTGPLTCGAEDVLSCARCRQQYALKQGVPALVLERSEAKLERVSTNYRQARRAEGWPPMTQRQLIALPDGHPKGYPPLYWEVRRQTFDTFVRFLNRHGPAPREGAVVDLGAGVGWLAHRLAQRGYRTLAVDANLDREFGLGASAPYRAAFPERFLPVQGDLASIPLRIASCSVIIFNASLHYSDQLASTLHRAARSLRPDGCVVILDTPLARRRRPSSGLGDRHLGRAELDAAMCGAGLRPRFIEIRRGLRWHAYQIRAMLRGDTRFSFPMVVGSILNKEVENGES